MRPGGRITHEDIHNVAFSKPPIGKRGYNEDEVDAFLDVLERQVQSDQARLAELEEEVERLRNQQPMLTHQEPLYPMQAPSPAAPEPVSASAARILALAEQTAETLTNEAKAQADQTLTEAQQRAAQTLSAAERQASDTVTQAKMEAAGYQQKVETLRAFERNYRQRLKDYIGSQYEALNTEETVE